MSLRENFVWAKIIPGKYRSEQMSVRAIVLRVNALWANVFQANVTPGKYLWANVFRKNVVEPFLHQFWSNLVEIRPMASFLFTDSDEI
jgi:hypothetical protein